MKRILIFAILTLSLGGCAVKPLAYFVVEPYAKPFDNKINKTLYITFKDDVKDSFVVSGEGVKKMQVTQYRSSLQEAFKKTFEKNFANVQFTEKKSDSALTLVIFRVKPFWKIVSTHSTYNGYSKTSTTTTDISVINQFESSLYFQGQKLIAADDESASDGTAAYIGSMPRIFEDGTRVMCELINKSIFTDAVVQKIK